MDRQEALNNFYTQDCEEDTRLTSKHGKVEFITTTTYIDKYLKQDSKILEIGAGTGAYSLYYAKKGYDVTSIEFVQSNLDKLKEGITPNMKIKAEQGDAIDLSRFGNNTFDVTLVLGPLYHLFEKKDIDKAIDEAIRVTKPGGKIFYAFLPNDSIVIGWVLKKRNFDKKGYSYDENFEMAKNVDEIFSAFYIDEFENLMSNRQVKKLHYVATDGMSHHFKEIVDDLSDFEFNEWVRYCLLSCERRELLGYSNHVLYICEKL